MLICHLFDWRRAAGGSGRAELEFVVGRRDGVRQHGQGVGAVVVQVLFGANWTAQHLKHNVSPMNQILSPPTKYFKKSPVKVSSQNVKLST